MNKLILVLMLLLAILTRVKAQSFDDILNASYNMFSQTNNQVTNSNIKSMSMSLSKIYFSGPPIVVGRLRVIYNLEHKWYKNNYSAKSENQVLFADNLHDTRLTTIFNFKLVQKWALNYVNFSTIKSDYVNLDIVDAYKDIHALTVGFQPKEDGTFRMGLGLSFSHEMGELLILPVAFLYYKKNNWFIDLMYPRLNVFYKPAKRFEVGCMVNYDIGAFDVEFDKDLISEMTEKPEYQTTMNLTVTPQVNFYVTDNLSVFIRGGVNLISETGLMDKDYHDIDDFGYEANKVVSTFGAGLMFKIPH